MSKNKIRLDDYVISHGYFSNKDEVLRSALSKEIRVGTTYITSSATLIELDDNDVSKQEIFIKNQKQFVSRGGKKLQKAIEYFDIDVKGKNCLDIGSSTGGFTDCLLQNGAKQVTCVDVNYGQLAWQLRSNNKVKVFERLNIKEAMPKELGSPFDVIVTDVSFISLASIASNVASFSNSGTLFVGLIKPQFECKRGEAPNGIVRDDSIRLRTIDEVKSAFQESGFEIIDVTDSPIKGHSGNIEFLIYCRYR